MNFSVQRGLERIMFGVTLRYRKRASWISVQTKVEDILTTSKKKKWTWIGHVMRQTHNRWTVRVIE